MNITETILEGIKKAIHEGGKQTIDLREASNLTGSGSGIGGNGGTYNDATAGAANTGSGGGGGAFYYNNYPGASGGSGVVILKIPTANYTAPATPKYFLVRGACVPPNDVVTLNLGLTLPAATIISANASTSNLSFSAFGVEIN